MPAACTDLAGNCAAKVDATHGVTCDTSAPSTTTNAPSDAIRGGSLDDEAAHPSPVYSGTEY